VETVEHASVDDGGDNAAVSMLVAEPQADNSGPAESASSSSDHASNNSLDADPAPAAAEASDHGSSSDEAPAQAAADSSPVAPTVAMVSAEALQAAGVDGNAQHGGAVEQIVADALGHGDAPTVDAALANLPNGNGALQALANMASPDAANVSGWDMGGHGHGAAVHEMMLSMHASNMHHDAVQPAVNG
jgi:hypothetical protein